ncbi:MAG: hypothetical protein ACE5G3_12375 [Gammaproteobacteria bacterium]
MFQGSTGLVCAWLLGAVAPAVADAGPDAEPPAVAAASDPAAGPDESRPWSFTLYTIWLSEEQLGDMLLFQAALESSQAWVAAVSRRIGPSNRHVDTEIEGQLAKHAGPVQRHWEANGLGALRWKTFPWNNMIDTTAAVGLGLSYAFDDPTFERNAHGTSNQWLVYILVELTASLPKVPTWALVARIHHRSAAYGTFEDDLEGASNAFGVGIKYRF